MGVKISDLTAKGSKIAATDLIEISVVSGPGYVSRSITGAQANELSLDTSPQLGGNLDINGNSIVSTSNGNINITPHGTGAVVILIPISTQTLQYTLTTSDNCKLIECNFGSSNNIIIPTNAAQPLPIGANILISQYGAGQVTIVPNTGVTLRSSGGKTKIAAQYGMATLIKRGTNEWYLAGDITT
jgi:hypothetical protein